MPPRGSHRSGRAQLRHPAPRMMASLLRRTQFRYLAGLRRDNLPAQCPRHLSPRKSHHPVGRFPFAGSSGASSPTSPVLSADSDFSSPFAPRFVSFARHYHRFATPSLPRGVTIPRGPGPLLPRRPHRLSSVEKTRPPRFLDNPCVHAPLSDPGAPPAPGHYRTGDGVFRTGYYVDSTMMVISGLNHAACTLPVYASRPRSPQDAQHSVPAGGQPWPGRTLACALSANMPETPAPDGISVGRGGEDR